jgi:hypothetical protein
MESRGKFEQRFKLILSEENTVASAVGGTEGPYNDGDARIAHTTGVIQTRDGALKRKKKTKKRRKK